MTRRETLDRALLSGDARNRALRSFMVAVAVAIFIDVWPVINDALSSTDPVNWDALGRACLRVAMQTAGAFAMRRFLDPSRVPTPLPPENPGPPAD